MDLRGVGHRYGLRGAWVLRGVDLTLPAGTLVRVEGANGTGKSTLLRLLAGIDAPSEGRITGRRTRTAYVPERFPAALPLTATGYLVHHGRIHGLRSAEAKRRAGEWLTRFGAAEHARTPLAELFKGTSQKVAVAQEPPAARGVASAAAGPRRVHLAALLTAAGCTAALAVVTTVVVLLISEPVTEDGGAVSRPAAALAGLLAVLCCVLVGAAVGALSTRPVPLRRGWSVAAAVLGSLLALVTAGSPARVAVTALVTGARTGTVPPPVLPLLGAAALAAAAAFLVCRIAARRG